MSWAECTFHSCSVLPVRTACDLSCHFCFSHSSVSALRHERRPLSDARLQDYFAFARSRGATRLVITGGGEPLLRPSEVLRLLRLGAPYFGERACFSNGSALTGELARSMREEGLSYLCWSRHSDDDEECRELMGSGAPALKDVLQAAGDLPVRATCVMARGYVDSRERVARYVSRLREHGIREFTFKHTYVAYEHSVFGDSPENRWARDHQVEFDPFEGEGTVVARLPWGPAIRKWEGVQVCWYREPTPGWELENRICRSANLLSDGSVYASLEDARSLLFQLTNS